MSVVQGLGITLGLLFMYQYGLYNYYSESVIRTIVFLTLIGSNIFLTLSNRSFYYSIFTTLAYKNNLVLLIVGITVLMTSMLLFVPSLRRFFEFEMITFLDLISCILVSATGVFWIEIYKFIKRKRG
jgi:Ca2+-transporting ATPase